MTRHIEQFSYHGKQRLHERTKLRMSDVKRLFSKDLFYIVGTDEKEPHIFHCLIYSKPDNQPYIILLNSNNDIVVSVLYFDYQSWNIDYNLVYDLKNKQEKNINEKFSILNLKKTDCVYKTIERLVNSFSNTNNKYKEKLIKYFLNVIFSKYHMPFSYSDFDGLSLVEVQNKILKDLDYDQVLFKFFVISEMSKYSILDLSKEPTNKLFNIITCGYSNKKDIVFCISEKIYISNIDSFFKNLSFRFLVSLNYFDDILGYKTKHLKNILLSLKDKYQEDKNKLDKIEKIYLWKQANILSVNKFNQVCVQLMKTYILNGFNEKTKTKKLIITTSNSKISYELSGHKENLEDYFYHDFLSSKKAEVLNICEQDVESVIFVHKDNIENRII